jgi:hypothetical protein
VPRAEFKFLAAKTKSDCFPRILGGTEVDECLMNFELVFVSRARPADSARLKSALHLDEQPRFRSKTKVRVGQEALNHEPVRGIGAEPKVALRKNS